MFCKREGANGKMRIDISREYRHMNVKKWNFGDENGRLTRFYGIIGGNECSRRMKPSARINGQGVRT